MLFFFLMLPWWNSGPAELTLTKHKTLTEPTHRVNRRARNCCQLKPKCQNINYNFKVFFPFFTPLVELTIQGLLSWQYKIDKTFDSSWTKTFIPILCAREASTNPKPLWLIICKSILFRRTQQARLRVALGGVLSRNVGGIFQCLFQSGVKRT